jgi:hypothetical protein
MPIRHLNNVLLLALLLPLSACNRDQSGTPTSAKPPAEGAKADSRQPDKRDEGPKVADPMKEGY